MQITRRDVAILCGFVVVLVLGATWFVRRATTPPSESPDGARVAKQPGATLKKAPRSVDRQVPEPTPAPGAQEGTLPAATPATAAPRALPASYQVIGQRKLFQPLLRVQTQPTNGAAPRRLPAVPPISPGPMQVRASTPAPRATVAATHPAAAPAAAPAPPPPPPLAVTGLLRWGDGYRVVIENTEMKESRVVKVGGEAFGYRVSEVAGDQREVKLEPTATGSRSVVLKLGEGKKVEEKQEAKPATSGESAGQSGAKPAGESPSPTPMMRGGFDPNNLTPEQRQRWEEWQRRRAERRRSRGE